MNIVRRCLSSSNHSASVRALMLKMSTRPKLYKPYVHKDSQQPVPKSTKHYQKHKFPPWMYDSTSSSDVPYMRNKRVKSVSFQASRVDFDDSNDANHDSSAEDDPAIPQQLSNSDDSSDSGDHAMDTTVGGASINNNCDATSGVISSSMQAEQNHSDASNTDGDTSSTAVSSEFSDEESDDENLESIFENSVEFLSKEETNNRIDTSFVVSRAELLFAVLAFSAHYKLPNDGIANLCSMINSCVQSDILPQTKYLLDKLFCSEEGIEYHAMCPKCKAYVGQFTRQDRSISCRICNNRILLKKSHRDFYVTFDITHELRELIEDNAEHFISVISGGRRSPGKLKDFSDGRVYLNFVQSLPEEIRRAYATLLCMCDGAALYRGTKFSLWPIWVTPNEIPIRVRNSNPIPAACWYGHDKPNMTYFLSSFVERINRLSTVGLSCKIGNEVKCIRAFAICFCVDCMARYAMQGSTIFHGYYSCAWCLHPGVLILHKTRKAMKFPIMIKQPLQRTELESLWHIRQALGSGLDSYGFPYASPLLKLKGMIITDGFVPDHMHQVDLGTTKQLTEYRIEKRRKPFSFTKSQIALKHEYLLKLKVPSILERLTRSIYERKVWNSREWENWLLFYSLPILMEIEGYSKFVQHWEHLVGDMYILLKDEIDFAEIRIADKNLRTFLFMTQALYSEDAMTYNIHQTGEHLVQSVVDWGPACTHSGYPSEAGNGDLKKKVKAANGVIHHLNRSIARDRSSRILKKHLENLCAEEEEESPVLDFGQHLKGGKAQNTEKVGSNRYFIESSVRESILQKHGLPASTCGYDKLVRDGCVFQKWTKKQSRSDDSFVMLNDGSYVKIMQFLHDTVTKSEVTLSRRVRVVDIFPNAPQMKKIIAIDDEKIIVDTNSIVKSCAMLKVNDKRYVCAVPNMHLY